MKVEAGFTLDELLAFLHAEQEENGQRPGYRTTSEWCQHFGISHYRMWALLREAKAAGILRVERATRVRVDGTLAKQPVYAFDLGGEET